MTRAIDYHTYKPLLDCFVSTIKKDMDDQVVSIVLYGSVARGNARAESDIDLLLVLEEASPIYRERLQAILPILRNLRQTSCWKDLEAQHIFPSPSVVILTRDEAEQNRSLYLDMIGDSQILLDRGNFFQNRLKILQNRLKELGSQKIQRGDGWYWDLKPDLKPDEILVL
tara:strand:+ start:261 stop:770 length:510 start_codon:yes stop_codon:yes gene_type:complete